MSDIELIASLITEDPDILIEQPNVCRQCGAPATMQNQRACTQCGVSWVGAAARAGKPQMTAAAQQGAAARRGPSAWEQIGKAAGDVWQWGKEAVHKATAPAPAQPQQPAPAQPQQPAPAQPQQPAPAQPQQPNIAGHLQSIAASKSPEQAQQIIKKIMGQLKGGPSQDKPTTGAATAAEPKPEEKLGLARAMGV